MTYEEALDNVYGRLVFGIKPGLERISALLDRLGAPHKQLKFVHVAGTNGKGTCSTLVASALQACGLKVGLYTSPYVLEFRERFQIDGEMIPKEELVEEVETLAPISDQFEESGDQVTEFEYITALALHWFARRQCDIVVLEVGMGGRFDATNVIDVPEVAAIMSISLDHTAILGSTLEKIAFEKAGIVKAGGRLVLYPDQAPEVTRELEQICQERQVELFRPDLSQVEEGERSIGGTAFTVAGTRWGDVALRTPFLGEHQVKNAVTVLACVKELKKMGWNIPDDALQQGFATVSFPGRMEVLRRQPPVILDGAHNPEGTAALAKAMKKYVTKKRVIGVCGMMADKNAAEAVRRLDGTMEKVFTAAPCSPRAMSAQELAALWEKRRIPAQPMASLREALQAALKEEGAQHGVLVCGSLYLAGEARPLLKELLNQKE